MKRLASLATALILLASTAAAEFEISLYGGTQSSPHSRATGLYPGTRAPYSGLIGWEGRSFSPPPYYGARATWWRTPELGFGLEFTHAKVYAPAAERAAIGFSSLELTDGHNIITFNVTKRWNDRFKGFTPYVGAGLGVALPHVDVVSTNGFRTFGYQLTGPALRLTAGAKYDLNDSWSLFSEYQFTVSQNKATLNGGGTLDTRIITNAINFGASYSF